MCTSIWLEWCLRAHLRTGWMIFSAWILADPDSCIWYLLELCFVWVVSNWICTNRRLFDVKVKVLHTFPASPALGHLGCGLLCFAFGCIYVHTALSTTFHDHPPHNLQRKQMSQYNVSLQPTLYWTNDVYEWLLNILRFPRKRKQNVLRCVTYKYRCVTSLKLLQAQCHGWTRIALLALRIFIFHF